MATLNIPSARLTVRGKAVALLIRVAGRATPAIAPGRLSLTSQGQVRYTLKTPYRDGTAHVVFAPLDFLARLAALVPRPRVHLTRYHGEVCGGKVRVIASIEEPAVIDRILGHLASRAPPAGPGPSARGPPQGELEFF